MTTQNLRHLGNIGVFDLRNASEEAIGSIGSVQNVGLLITSPDTAGPASRIHTHNVGAYVSAPPKAKLINGGLNIGANHFRDRESTESLIVNGRLLVEQGVSVEDVAAGLDSLHVNGAVYYPSSLESIVQSKIQWQNGRAIAYGDDDIVCEGQLMLDENYLNALNDDSDIIVIGRLILPDVLPNELLKRKVRSIKVTGAARFHEENQATLQSALHQTSRRSKMSIIPQGFQYHEMPINLNSATLQSLASAKLFVDGQVLIERGVESAQLDSSIAAINTTDLLLCPNDLSSVVAQKCDLLQTRAVFYGGELWLVEDEFELTPSRFEFMEGNATLVVRGEFYVSPDVEPKTLAGRIESIHNYGDIYCSKEQMGAIQARMQTSEGDIQDYASRDTSDARNSNHGYLAL